jgi:Arc/MetJ-type ribon-helix-helix transcriptional regulator
MHAEIEITAMSKNRRSITIDKDLMDWINQQIACKRFKDVSHAFEYSVYRLKEEENQKKAK